MSHGGEVTDGPADAEQQTAGAHRRDSGVRVGQPEEAISRFKTPQQAATAIHERTDRQRPVRLVGVGHFGAFSW